MDALQELNAQIEMNELIKKLNEATEKYNEGYPIMSDTQWDKMYFRLVELETRTGLVLPGSPSHEIHYIMKDKLDKITHNHPMLSLDKTQEVEAISAFVKRYGDWVVMPKMDGLTCSLTYENGELISAETRGDGIVGEDILHNALVLPSVPRYIKYKKKLVIDGEVICTLDIFNKYFANDYKNARNFASGSIRLLNSHESQSRLLTFVVWDVITPIEGEDNTLIAQLKAVSNLGFIVVPGFRQDDNSIKDIKRQIELIQAAAEFEKYPIDGVVFKFNDLSLRDKLGSTAHHFNNAIAFKFEDEKYDTKLLDIEWTMGRTGVLTPVAIFEAVDADGSIIERASLHNFSVMQNLLGTPYIGQKLLVIKAHMIIPQIIWADKSPRPEGAKEISLICKCPICGHPINMVKSDSSTINIVCSNSACDGKLVNRLEHFAGKSGLDIKGISKATLEKLIDWGWISQLSDIFQLEKFRAEWINKPGFGCKSVDNILQAIQESKNVTLDRFICAIGIPLIGKSASKELVKKFASYADFRAAINNGFDFSSLPDFGPESHSAIIHYNYENADYIAKQYLNFEEPAVGASTDSLAGKTFVITGKLQNFKNRAELQNVIEAAGGKVASSVSSKTSYLINNDTASTSSKNQAAQRLGVPIISESEFISTFIDK